MIVQRGGITKVCGRWVMPMVLAKWAGFFQLYTTSHVNELFLPPAPTARPPQQSINLFGSSFVESPAAQGPHRASASCSSLFCLWCVRVVCCVCLSSLSSWTSETSTSAQQQWWKSKPTHTTGTRLSAWSCAPKRRRYTSCAMPKV